MVPRQSIRGARPSNAGDDFHELWALREVLGLLDPSSTLKAITLEGLHPDDQASATPSALNGIDIAYYCGGESLASATMVGFDQVKYSTAKPNVPWSVARLTRRRRGNASSSVFGRLGKAFEEYHSKRPDLVDTDALRIRLVSNQPISQEVLETFHGSAGASANRRALEKASGVPKSLLSKFFRSLDFGECGAGSRLQMAAELVQTISSRHHPNARDVLNDLRRQIRELVMPEGEGVVITRLEVLSWLGFTNDAALFPCRPLFRPELNVVARPVTETLRERLCAGEQRICLYGGAGVGKTTVLLGLAARLPPRSVMIVFDCYGAGSYLDAESPRHRPREAFLQIANELAARLKLVPVIHRNPDVSEFAERLREAAASLASSDPNAWLVIAIDAADNAAHAASVAAPPERAFVGLLARIGEIPPNVRMIVSTRTSRMESLGLDSRFERILVAQFEPSETIAAVLQRWPAAPSEWISDFHRLSRGNPRVQSYAFGRAGSDPVRALMALLPNGKTIDQVFDTQLREAMGRAGISETDVQRIAQGLLALPRAVPITHLSRVVEKSEDQLREFVTDLASGLRLVDDTVGFTDEDFEDFVRGIAGDLDPIRDPVAECLLESQENDVYSAIHVAPALLAAGRRQALLALVRKDGPPAIIQDPVLRREVQLQRMRIAMRVCLESGDLADALLTALRGGSALKTDAATKDALRRFPDLAVRFARRSVSQMFLQNREEVEYHGRFLFHRMRADAERRDFASVRDDARSLQAWLQHRDGALASAKRKHERAPGWEISDDEITSEVVSDLLMFKPRVAWQHLCRWRPPEVRYRALLLAAPVLVATGRADILTKLGDELQLATLDVIIPVAIARCDGNVDTEQVESALRRLERRGLAQATQDSGGWELPAWQRTHDETLLTACEWCLADGVRSDVLTSILASFMGSDGKQTVYDAPARIDLRLRALATSARLNGREISLSDLHPPKPILAYEATAEDRRTAGRWEEQKREWEETVGPLIPLYDARALCLLGLVNAAGRADALRRAFDHFERESYRMTRRPRAHEMRARAANALLSLLGRHDADVVTLWRYAQTLTTLEHHWFDQKDVERWIVAAARAELHPTLLADGIARANEIRQAQMAAHEQVDCLCMIARALLPVSTEDAKVIFIWALDAAAGIDEDAMHLVPVIADLAHAGASTLGQDERRHLAVDTAVVLEDAAMRLSGYDGFPWSQAALALTHWDFQFALAAVARWDDEGVVSREKLLPPVVCEGVIAGCISPSAALALAPLWGYVMEPSVQEAVVAHGTLGTAASRNAMAELLASDELLTGGEAASSASSHCLEAVRALREASQPGNWEAALTERLAFHATRAHEEGCDLKSTRKAEPGDELPTAQETIEAYPWATLDLATPTTLTAAVEEICRLAENRPYVPPRAVYSYIRERVPIQRRIDYLDALVAQMRDGIKGSPDVDDALREALVAWRQQPAVQAWIVGPMLSHLPDVLPAFLRWVPHQGRSLQYICRQIAVSKGEATRVVADALLRGLERHVEVLSAPEIYWLVGLVGEYVEPAIAGRVATGLVRQLFDRVTLAHRAEWKISDIPETATTAIGRLLYAFLGDMDTRNRWRGAHVLRRFAYLGQLKLLDAVVDQYDRQVDALFRAADAPFYWQAARLWLVIAVCRIAHDRPTDIARHSDRLVSAGTDDAFPHLLLRAFALDAARALRAAEVAGVSDSDIERLKLAVGAGRPRSRMASQRRFRARAEEVTGVRFHFDQMDTIPYWYERAVDVFADVSMQTFLTSADRWIIDVWGASPTASHWGEEPRRHRLDDSRWGEWSHSHGSLPLIERYSAHLEWHAMWCAAGELLPTHTLRLRDSKDDDDYDSIEGWLRRSGLGDPPLWLSDVRSARPLHHPLYIGSPSKGWEEAVSEADFLEEGGLASAASMVILGASWVNDNRPVHESVRIRSAFVTPSRALSLVRALQTAESTEDFYLPDVGEESEIRQHGRSLLGVLSRPDHDSSGIDEHDPLRRGTNGLPAELPPEVAASFGLHFVLGPSPGWRDAQTGELLVRLETWSDHDPYSRFPRDSSGNAGWRLSIDRALLAELVSRRKLDVVLSVGIERHLNQTGSYDANAEEDAPSAQHSRIYLLRRNGDLYTAEGRAGTWTTPSS